MSGIVQLVDELCDALVTFEPARWSGSDCADLAERFARGAKACEAASARAAARAADCGADRSRGDATAREWFARVSGSSGGAARSALATASFLATCPATRDALAAGEVSLAQAAQIVAIPEHEEELLELARSSGLRAVKDTARKRWLAGIKPEELQARQHAARTFRHWKDELGMIRFRGALPPIDGVALVNRLDAQTDREWRTARREQRDEPRRARAADAFVHMMSRSSGTTKQSRSADVVFVIDSRAYRRGHAHPGEPCHVIGGGPVPVEAVREQIDDAFVKAVLHDGVDIQMVAHHGRRRPAELQTALELGPAPTFEGVVCAEPGCDRIYGLQWDHVDPCANGGLTSLGNMQPFVHAAPLREDRARPEGRTARGEQRRARAVSRSAPDRYAPRPITDQRSPSTGDGVAITGLANLAVKVADLDAACAFYESAGADVRDRMEWNNGERADVYLGPVMITLFTHAIYEDAVDLPREGFLHPALFTDDLDRELIGHDVVWGPAVVEGAFGKRRIAFVAAPGNIRLEFMQQIEEPA